MANLSEDDRGQLILVGAFIIAAAFIVLALVVNSAIFTENLATRDDVPGSQDALEFRDEVHQGVSNVIEGTNQNNGQTETDAEESVTEVGVLTGVDQSVRNRVVEVSHASTTLGFKFAQDESRELTNNDSADNWTLATGVNRSRNVQFDITEFNGGAFEYVLNQSASTEWVMRVSQSGSAAVVEVSPPTASADSCVRENADNITIDVTAATVDGDPCPALDRLSDGTTMRYGTGITARHNVSFRNGSAVNGTYSFIVEDDGTAQPFDPLAGDNFGTPPDRPYYIGSPAVVYSMTVDYAFYTSQVGYEAQVRVAPGEVGA